MTQFDGVGKPDFILLDDISEDSFMKNLQERFENARIYTYIGETVVSINPYRELDIYNDKTVEEYRNREIFERPPHVFALADAAFQDMKWRQKNACIVISGESGAGKTEASKIIMKYISKVTAHHAQYEVERVKNLLLESNPILEAFGNARTNRNDNSSRFGKYMDINFDFKADPLGGHIKTYLLEKARVISQQEGERSFHIFYQVLGGLDDQTLASLQLQRNPAQYRYLKGGGEASVITRHDKALFDKVRYAMKSMKFSPDEQTAIWKIIAAIMHLGNVDLVANHDGETSSVANMTQLEPIANLLGTKAQLIAEGLTKRTLATRGEVLVANLKASLATYTRDAMAKAMYQRLFDWVVRKVNDSVEMEDSGVESIVIGVLDIYGFEIFKLNSFEQFCINYCNEKLQQLFIKLVLKREQEEYEREGIEWVHIDYFNNETICKLIDGSPQGIFNIMDEECLRPGEDNDERILIHMDKVHIKHDHYSSNAKGVKDLRRGEEFRILHYAGDVTYSVLNFMDKNKDTFFQDLKRLLFGCKLKLLQEMWPEGANPIGEVTKRPITAGTAFKNSMIELVNQLEEKEPHYVRCIKPNNFKRSSEFDRDLCLHQVRYLGLIENVRVRRAGYAYRQKYELFMHRYKFICPSCWPCPKNGPKEGTKELMQYYNLMKVVTFGKTKIFIQNPRTLFKMERERDRHLPKVVLILQKWWRGVRVRLWLKRTKAVTLIALTFRNYKTKRWFRRVVSAFSNVRNQMDYGKSIAWPNPPPVLRKGMQYCQQIYNNWKARMIVNDIPIEKMVELRLKCIICDKVSGKKVGWGYEKEWLGNALQERPNPSQSQFAAALGDLQTLNRDNKCYYSGTVEKLNRSLKTDRRIYVVTDSRFYRMDERFTMKKKRPVEFSGVTGISMSSGRDQGVVIHCAPEYGGDCVCYVTDNRPAAELAAALCFACKRRTGKLIPITISDNIDYRISGKAKGLSFRQGPTGFQKVDGSRAVLQWSE